ncbi:response regulator transcription factor [Rhodococcus sp. IEGM 1318]|uniref:response regulator transcription factor n=1 Tax=Rhodococcus sp. IEGM 1318 TaxID=3082226 RepID=UPI0029552A7B|nr:response regulator transcription factor [Rhodococcus sp. IEGM 1318]MDV8009441.1 response regulator transcription factor [Rhodococcus sp. IEGM 1318]
MVIDDEALVRSGFELILGLDPEIDVVGTSDGRSAHEDIGRLRPDVVLLDIRMPHINGLEVLGRALQLEQAPVVAMLTTFDVDEYVVEALHLGASGFLLKDTDPHQLAMLVKTLAAGGVVLSPAVTRSVVSGYLPSREGSADAEAVARLSERERGVIYLASLGKSNREIAEIIHQGVGTVKDDMSAILAKLGVGTRVQAALIAQRAGIADPRR